MGTIVTIEDLKSIRYEAELLAVRRPHPTWISKGLLADAWPHEQAPTTNKKATDMNTITLKLNKEEQDAARNDDWDFIHNKIRSALPPHLERVYVGQQFADGERTYKVEHLGPKSDGTEPTLALCSVNGRGSEQFTVEGIRGLVASGGWVEVTDTDG